jgi:hypothetical protein
LLINNKSINIAELRHFKNQTIDNLNRNIILILDCEKESNIYKDYINKFEMKNGFLNIFLKHKGKEVVNNQLNIKKAIKAQPTTEEFNVKIY